MDHNKLYRKVRTGPRSVFSCGTSSVSCSSPGPGPGPGPVQYTLNKPEDLPSHRHYQELVDIPVQYSSSIGASIPPTTTSTDVLKIGYKAGDQQHEHHKHFQEIGLKVTEFPRQHCGTNSEDFRSLLIKDWSVFTCRVQRKGARGSIIEHNADKHVTGNCWLVNAGKKAVSKLSWTKAESSNDVVV